MLRKNWFGKDSGKSDGQEKVWRGNFTVEAACIVPIVFFLIWNVLYLSFFLYNESLSLQGSYCTALRTERLVAPEAEKVREAEKKYEESVKKRIAMGQVESTKNVSEGDVTVRITHSMKAPAGWLFSSDWRGEQEQTALAWQPVDFIRNCRKAEAIQDFIQAESE